MHTRQMINSLQQQGQDSHWVDGEWEHTLPDDFEFPDISHFTFVSKSAFYCSFVSAVAGVTPCQPLSDDTRVLTVNRHTIKNESE